MKTRILFVLLFTVLLAMLMIGCGGSGSSTPPPPPIKVTISPPIASLNGGDTQQFTATVTGTTSTAVMWSCSGTGCGTIDSTGLYTAPTPIPNDGSVSIVATLQSDSTKTATAAVTHVAVAVTISEKAITVYEGDSHQYSVTLKGTKNSVVAWSLADCSFSNCGTIDATGMYRAPTSIPVAGSARVIATSQADNAKFDDGRITLLAPLPIEVGVAPSTANVKVGGNQNFTATVQNDNSNAGVTWSLGASCTPDRCGSLSNITNSAVTYTAPPSVPSPTTVNLTATSVTDPGKSVTAVITVTESSGLHAGNYVFVFNGWEQNSPWPTRLAIAGHFQADADGNISNGVEDINRDSGVSLSVAFTGTYTLDSNRRGSLSITTADGTVTYSMSVDTTGTKGNFIRLDSPIPEKPVSGAGYFEAQDTSKATLASVAGSYALGLSSKPVDGSNMASIGRMTVSATGAFSNGKMDVQTPTVNSTNASLTGSMAAPSASTGRGTATMTVSPQPGAFSGTMTFVYYIVSADKIVLLQRDTRGSTVADMSGEARRQTEPYSTASFNVPVVFRMNGMSGYNNVAIIGQLTPGGNGNMNGVRDQNFGSTLTLNDSFIGTYAVDASGRATMTLPTGDAVAYFFGKNEGYMMQITVGYVVSGSFKPQTGGPFSAASIGATYRHGEGEAISTYSECDSGVTTFDGMGAFSGSQDYTYFNSDGSSYYYNVGASQQLSGTYAVAENGRGELSVFGYPMAFWVVSPDEIVAVDTTSPYDSLPVLLQYMK